MLFDSDLLPEMKLGKTNVDGQEMSNPLGQLLVFKGIGLAAAHNVTLSIFKFRILK